MQTATLEHAQVLPDQAERDLFRNEPEKNYSVIAPAGVGKTTAIVDRITNIAKTELSRKCPILPRLIVVTFTRKAAQEMHDRAQRQMLGSSGDYRVLRHLDQAFFGTIHSFCLHFIKRLGPLKGVASDLEIISPTDEALLWERFVIELDWSKLLREEASILPRLVDIHSVIATAKTLNGYDCDERVPACPLISKDALLGFTPNKRNQAAVKDEQERLRKWFYDFEHTSLFVGIPECKKGGVEFKALWQSTFEALEDWLSEVMLVFLRKVAKCYFDYRLSRKKVFYDDLVFIARMLMQDDAIRNEVYKQNWCILLDEAQDTDKDQFAFLLEVVCPMGLAIRPGSFSMVGDPQQSIYSSRSSVYDYLKIHQDLTRKGYLKELTLSVTMRCPHAVVDTVNTIFPKLWASKKASLAQAVTFVPLKAKPQASLGSIQIKNIGLCENLDTPAEAHEAHYIAKLLEASGPCALGAQGWGGVALLAPRRKWLVDLTKALQARGLPCQIHSHESTYADNPVFAWMTALVVILEDPFNSFEIVGVLREVFGLSDHDIATFVHRYYVTSGPKHPIQIFESSPDDTKVGKYLNRLHDLRKEVAPLPLCDLMHTLYEKLGMMARFEALPPEVLTEHCKHWGDLLKLVIDTEMKGGGLLDFKKVLLSFIKTPLPEEALDEHSIQLFTYHKAKGLEWPVVILPFLGRKVSEVPVLYPYVYEGRGVSRLVLNNRGKQAICAAYEQQESKSEFERLVYVALTRAKKTILLIDDRVLFDAPSNALTIADSLDLNHLKALNFGSRYPLLEVTPVEPEAGGLPEGSIKWPRSSAAKARDCSWSVLTKCLPSGLAEHAPEKTFLEINEIDVLKKGGKGYGNWWHSLMQHFPWKASENEINDYIIFNLRKSPNPERGHQEVVNFQKTPMYPILLKNAYTIRTEIPLTWVEDKHFYEGVIDCLFLDSDGQITLIDWKTDIVSENQIKLLKDRYYRQLALYASGLSKILRKEVSYNVYSTYNGLLLHLGIG